MSSATPEAESPYPFLFYGHRPSSWQPGARTDHFYRVQFQSPPDEAQLRELAGAAAASRLAAAGGAWLWVGRWLGFAVAEADDSEFFFDDVEDLLLRLNDVHPLREVVYIDAEGPSDSEWEAWSMELRPEPEPGPDFDRDSAFYALDLLTDEGEPAASAVFDAAWPRDGAGDARPTPDSGESVEPEPEITPHGDSVEPEPEITPHGESIEPEPEISAEPVEPEPEISGEPDAPELTPAGEHHEPEPEITSSVAVDWQGRVELRRPPVSELPALPTLPAEVAALMETGDYAVTAGEGGALVVRAGDGAYDRAELLATGEVRPLAWPADAGPIESAAVSAAEDQLVLCGRRELRCYAATTGEPTLAWKPEAELLLCSAAFATARSLVVSTFAGLLLLKADESNGGYEVVSSYPCGPGTVQPFGTGRLLLVETDDPGLALFGLVAGELESVATVEKPVRLVFVVGDRVIGRDRDGPLEVTGIADLYAALT